MALPCGQVGGWPSSVQTESVASGERMCSSSQAWLSVAAPDEREQVAEEPLGEPVAPHHAPRPLLARGGERHAPAVETDQPRR